MKNVVYSLRNTMDIEVIEEVELESSDEIETGVKADSALPGFKVITQAHRDLVEQKEKE